MNGNAQKLIWWILGALLVVTMSLSSTLFGMIQRDIENMDRRIEQIQSQYYKIDVIQQQLNGLTREIRMRKIAE